MIRPPLLLIAARTQPTPLMSDISRATRFTSIMALAPLPVKRMTLASVMQFRMFRSRYHAQIFGPVVVLDAVNVMDDFTGREVTTEHTFHHKAMFQNIAKLRCVRMIRGEDHNVSRTVDAATNPPRVILAAEMRMGAIGRAKARTSSFDIGRYSLKPFSADDAGAFNTGGILSGHRDQSSRCRAGGVRSTARPPHIGFPSLSQCLSGHATSPVTFRLGYRAAFPRPQANYTKTSRQYLYPGVAT